MFQFQIICLSFPQNCAPTRVVSLISLVLPSVTANPCRNTHTIHTVHVYTTPVCACVFLRPPEPESNGLHHLPVQEICLCVSLWPAGVWWYVFCVFVFVYILSEWMHERRRESPPCVVGVHTLSRGYKCVLKRGTAAACPCAGLMKKIIQVIQIKLMKQAPPSSSSDPLSRAPSAGRGGRPGRVGLFPLMASTSAGKTRVSLLLGSRRAWN